MECIRDGEDFCLSYSASRSTVARICREIAKVDDYYSFQIVKFMWRDINQPDIFQINMAYILCKENAIQCAHCIEPGFLDAITVKRALWTAAYNRIDNETVAFFQRELYNSRFF